MSSVYFNRKSKSEGRAPNSPSTMNEREERRRADQRRSKASSGYRHLALEHHSPSTLPFPFSTLDYIPHKRQDCHKDVVQSTESPTIEYVSSSKSSQRSQFEFPSSKPFSDATERLQVDHGEPVLGKTFEIKKEDTLEDFEPGGGAMKRSGV